ncbi:alpha/beta fold hydrolase [Ramlibacter terrae]|uniref:Alpha/beta fold hydrolase n=1 Tax=Ramlibacter terrae TaxID=2732511 RepID=A0ABX6P6K0_9BURK|nr:alpha/beta fold hydrolase [Ramlibacter terrae]
MVLFAIFLGRRVDATLRPQGEWIEVEGERLHYRTLGEGPPIVLVHGLGGNMRNFDYLPLAELARDFRLVLLDRPGSGHSPRSSDARAALGEQARVVAGFLRAMRFDRPPLLVGHSLGGAVSLAVALREPDAVAGLALIAPLTHDVPEPPPAFKALAIRKPRLRRALAYTTAMPASIARGQQVLTFVFAPEPPPRDFPVRGGGLLGLRPQAFYATSTDLTALEHQLAPQEARYGELRLPVHLLYGDGDRVLDWKVHGQALAAKVPQARLQVVPGAGHMLPVTQPQLTAEFLRRAAGDAFCATVRS